MCLQVFPACRFSLPLSLSFTPHPLPNGRTFVPHAPFLHVPLAPPFCLPPQTPPFHFPCSLILHMTQYALAKSYGRSHDSRVPRFTIDATAVQFQHLRRNRARL